MAAGRKREVALRILRGKPLEIVARALGVTAAELSGWRNAFLEGGAKNLRARPGGDRDAKIDRLRTQLSKPTMVSELLQAKIERLEAGLREGPFELRRSKQSASSSRSPPAAATAPPASAVPGASRALASIAVVWPPPATRRLTGPQGPMPDAKLVGAIRQLALATADSLEESGFEVVVARDGKEAVARVESFHPDLIVTDYMMPNMAGDEMLRVLRGQGIAAPAILTTALSRQELPSGVFLSSTFMSRSRSAMPISIVRMRTTLSRSR